MDNRREYFESFADDWDKNFTAEDLEFLTFLIDTFNLKSGNRVVDLGCGTGVLFDIIRRRVGDSGMVVGVDFSSRMAHKALQNFPFRNCFAIDADVEQLPLQSGYFHLAVSFASFAHFAHPDRVIAEVARVLQPGAPFHIIHLLGSRELARHHHHAGGPVAHDVLPSADKMNEMFRSAGFDRIDIVDQHGLYHASGRKI